MKNKQYPEMTERFQAADGISLIVRWEKMKLAVTVFAQAQAGAERQTSLYKASG